MTPGPFFIPLDTGTTVGTMRCMDDPQDTTTDRERIAIALRYYLERVAWASSDAERDEFARLLAEFEDTDAR